MEKLFNYIDGVLVATQNNQYIDNYDPSKGEVYALIPDSDATDVELAVKAAKAAFPSWSVTPAIRLPSARRPCNRAKRRS